LDNGRLKVFEERLQELDGRSQVLEAGASLYPEDCKWMISIKLKYLPFFIIRSVYLKISNIKYKPKFL
jgi:hypothetical protein